MTMTPEHFTDVLTVQARLRTAINGIGPRLVGRPDAAMAEKYLHLCSYRLEGHDELLPLAGPCTTQGNRSPMRNLESLVLVAIDWTVQWFWNFCRTGVQANNLKVGLDLLEDFAANGWRHRYKLVPEDEIYYRLERVR
jgi:hypothetical protein